MSRQDAPPGHAIEQGSYGTPQIRVIVIGAGNAHRSGLRALVRRVLRDALGNVGVALRHGIVALDPSEPPADDAA